MFGCFGARVYAPLFFIWTKTDQHNVLVTHYGIRRLQSNTLWAGFPSCDILLGGGACWCWGPARQSRQSKLPSDRPDTAVKRGGEKWREGGEDARLQSSHAESDFHYQLWLFLFHFTTAINHRVTGSQGWRGWRAVQEKRANFHQKKNYLSKQVRWSRGFARGLWKRCGQTEIYLGLIGSGRVVRGE